jgi:hypothetical protein
MMALKTFSGAEAFFQHLRVVQLMKKFFLHIIQSLLLIRVRFEFLPTINVNDTVFCDVITCGLVDTDVSGKHSTSLSNTISRQYYAAVTYWERVSVVFIKSLLKSCLWVI